MGIFMVNKYTYGIKVRYDLIEESKALQALIVDALLGVEVREIWHAGEQHSDLGVTLTVEVVVVPVWRQEVTGHVRW